MVGFGGKSSWHTLQRSKLGALGLDWRADNPRLGGGEQDSLQPRTPAKTHKVQSTSVGGGGGGAEGDLGSRVSLGG